MGVYHHASGDAEGRTQYDICRFSPHTGQPDERVQLPRDFPVVIFDESLAASFDVFRFVTEESRALYKLLERSNWRLEKVLVAQGPSPSGVIQQRENAVILADELAELSADYREVIVLRNLEGLSFNEVAQRLSSSSEDAARTGLDLTRQYGMRMAMLTSGVLAGVADALKEQSSSNNSE